MTAARRRDHRGRPRRPGHVFNLGHGVLPDTDPDQLKRLTEFVQAYPSPEPAGRCAWQRYGAALGARSDSERAGVRRMRRTRNHAGTPSSRASTANGSSAPTTVATATTVDFRPSQPAARPARNPASSSFAGAAVADGLALDVDPDRRERRLVLEVGLLLRQRVEVGLAVGQLGLDGHDVADRRRPGRAADGPARRCASARPIRASTSMTWVVTSSALVVVEASWRQAARGPSSPRRSRRPAPAAPSATRSGVPDLSVSVLSSATWPSCSSTSTCTSYLVWPTSSLRNATGAGADQRLLLGAQIDGLVGPVGLAGAARGLRSVGRRRDRGRDVAAAPVPRTPPAARPVSLVAASPPEPPEQAVSRSRAAAAAAATGGDSRRAHGRTTGRRAGARFRRRDAG